MPGRYPGTTHLPQTIYAESRSKPALSATLPRGAAERPFPWRALIGAGNVLVSTAGPFLKIGRSAVEAAVDAGAVYVDQPRMLNYGHT